MDSVPAIGVAEVLSSYGDVIPSAPHRSKEGHTFALLGHGVFTRPANFLPVWSRRTTPKTETFYSLLTFLF